MERTEQKPYKSLCSDLFIGPSDYLAELICLRKQVKDNAGTLPIKFWNHPRYKNLYIREVSQAKILLRTWPVPAITQALGDWRARHIMSLRNKNLIPLIEEYSRNLVVSEFVSTKVEQEVSAKPVPKGRNIIGLL